MLRIRISGAPGTRKVCQRCGSGSDSGSRSFHQAKIVRNILIPTVSGLLYDLLNLKNDLKNDVNVRGASIIKVKNVNKKRMATARRLIFFGISQGIHC